MPLGLLLMLRQLARLMCCSFTLLQQPKKLNGTLCQAVQQIVVYSVLQGSETCDKLVHMALSALCSLLQLGWSWCEALHLASMRHVAIEDQNKLQLLHVCVCCRLIL